jgi:hypothetical protein
LNIIREELKSLDTSRGALRKFGWQVGGVLLVLGGWFLYRHKSAAPIFLAIGALLFLFGLGAPQRLRRVYLAWMSIGITLGLIVTAILLTFFYYLILTPIGLMARLAGKDFMERRKDPTAKTYWSPRPSRARDPAHFERQF